MIPTLLRASWLHLKRDRIALLLTFVLPIVFFTIFALIFGGMGSGGGSGQRSVIVVDEDDSEISRRFVQAIDDQPSMKVVSTPGATEENSTPAPYDREAASGAVRGGDFSVAIVIPSGFGESFGTFGAEGSQVDLVYDASNPYARFSTAGLLQAAAMQAAPDVLMTRGLGMLEQHGGALTPQQQTAVDDFIPFLRGDKPWQELEEDQQAGGETTSDNGAGDEGDAEAAEAAFTGLVKVNAVDVHGEDYNMIAYYAAGVSVMFLLFSMAGAGGAILEEEESGTLERLLTSNLSMTTLLASNWLFFAVLGMIQVAVMFIWAAFVFGLDLWSAKRLVGCLVMIVFTGAAAAAFGIIFATLCRSRAQLGGLSTIVILIMSALGGSMVPKFAAPAIFDLTSKFTFNGWALDGFLKVFWHDDPNATALEALGSLVPQLAVLAGMTVEAIPKPTRSPIMDEC